MLRETFELFDTDGSGAIDEEELLEAFNFLGMSTTRKEVQLTPFTSKSMQRVKI